MICSNCGGFMADNDKFCQRCGTLIQNMNINPPQYGTNGQPVQNPGVPGQAPHDPAKGFSISSLVCGIAGIVICCCFPVSIAAIVLGIIALKKNTLSRGMAIAGIICGGVAIVATLFLTFILGMTGYIESMYGGYM